jgi:hypothetical protein
MQFENTEDRDYYVHSDPVHQDFIKYLSYYLQNVRVVDFEDGKF